jgi:hypothetical protein
MADKLFPMYCGLNAIEGMHEEKAKCSDLLALARPREQAMVLIYMDGTEEWIYGQCNFLHAPDHTSPFKFSNTYTALREQGVLPALIDTHGVEVVFFVDASLRDRFATDASTRRYRSMFAVLEKVTDGYRRP